MLSCSSDLNKTYTSLLWKDPFEMKYLNSVEHNLLAEISLILTKKNSTSKRSIEEVYS